MVTGVRDIDFERLAARGLTHYCFDVDNTLVPQYSDVPAAGVVDHLRRAREAGFMRRGCLLSNTISGVRKRLRLKRVAEMFDFSDYFGCGFWIRKPHPLGYFWAQETLRVPASSIVMVGDQLYTDVWGGNVAGMYTILVNPLGADHWTTAVIGRRQRERWVLSQHSLERPNGGQPHRS